MWEQIEPAIAKSATDTATPLKEAPEKLPSAAPADAIG
jgi:hypothetical protein